jgi:hypothetical protein
MVTRYERGRSAEYRAVNELKEEGYEAVRVAGSHGQSDVIAWNDDHYRHIQVKTFIGPKPPNYTKEILKLAQIRLPSGIAQREFWMRRIGGLGWHQRLLVWNDSEGVVVWGEL